jgi:L-2-hydroxyglutarate oxidase LhgO
MTSYDIAIIGGGIVGLAVARALNERAPALRIVVLEKERRLASHQTGHNSGVVHSGLYYAPGSHKARLCLEGRMLLLDFCAARDVRVEHSGKLIVATREEELPWLEALHERAIANGVPVERVEPSAIKDYEPHAVGLRALWSPSTAVVDFAEVAEAIARELTTRGVAIETGSRVTSVGRAGDGFRIFAGRAAVHNRWLVNCAGLHTDVVARMAGARPDVRIVPFRGEYYRLKPERRNFVRGLIYPVPDPRLPFLGVHLTRTVHGEVEGGPNAVLALAREGYRRGRIDLGELAGMLADPGFWRMARRHWRIGSLEAVRSLRKAKFTEALQRLVPALRAEDLIPAGSGVRAQAVDPDGSLVDDFRIAAEGGAIHVLNAPSPAATASLAIGRHVASLAAGQFGLG